jgi:hypothetical protein
VWCDRWLLVADALKTTIAAAAVAAVAVAEGLYSTAVHTGRDRDK